MEAKYFHTHPRSRRDLLVNTGTYSCTLNRWSGFATGWIDDRRFEVQTQNRSRQFCISITYLGSWFSDGVYRYDWMDWSETKCIGKSLIHLCWFRSSLFHCCTSCMLFLRFSYPLCLWCFCVSLPRPTCGICGPCFTSFMVLCFLNCVSDVTDSHYTRWCNPPHLLRTMYPCRSCVSH